MLYLPLWYLNLFIYLFRIRLGRSSFSFNRWSFLNRSFNGVVIPKSIIHLFPGERIIFIFYCQNFHCSEGLMRQWIKKNHSNRLEQCFSTIDPLRKPSFSYRIFINRYLFPIDLLEIFVIFEDFALIRKWKFKIEIYMVLEKLYINKVNCWMPISLINLVTNHVQNSKNTENN